MKARPVESPRPKPGFVGAVVALASLAYPLLALMLVRSWGPLALVGAMAALLVARAALGLGKTLPRGVGLATLAVAGAMVVVSLKDAHLAMRLYPVFMNIAFLAAFALTLITPPSMIERFARMATPDLPPAAIAYTRNVTWVWCGFFVLNGAVALWTALGDDLRVWALYNGLVAYLLMAALLGGEWLVRGFFKSRA